MKKTSPQTLIQTLNWIQSTPPLFTDKASSYMVQGAIGDEICLPDIGSPALQTLIENIDQRPRIRLGLYYEALWHCLLEHHPEYSLLAHNLPVRTRKGNITVTLGEYDLIYQYEDQVFHRELAVKFYLGVPLESSNDSASPHHHWVGPGLKDRLDRKMQRTLNHQIVLGDTPEGWQVLKEQGVRSIHKEILIQGRLFYPLQGHCPPPKHSHPDHPKGLWMTRSEFSLWYQEHYIQQFFIPDKLQWIGFIPPQTWLSADELHKELDTLQTPQLVYTTDHCLFIVPDNWPEEARKIV